MSITIFLFIHLCMNAGLSICTHHKGQEKVSDPMELKFQLAIDPLQEQEVLLTEIISPASPTFFWHVFGQ